MKANRGRKRRLVLIANKLVAVITLFFFSAGYVFALPAGQQVVNGQASFLTQGNKLTITNSPNSIINWQGFSINNNEAVRFIQQNGASAVLNRVIGQDPSLILGLLQSNGRVFLINPNGMLFGQGARIDVNGLVASTLNIGNQDFLAGKYNFNAGSVAGSIRNQGTITTPSGGKVYLIAPDIENSGIINSPQGEVLLAAGHSVQLVDSLDPDIAVVVSAPENQAVNLGQIVAQSGKVGIYGGLIAQRGIVNADSAVAGENGKIIFKAKKNISLDAGSVVSAKSGTIEVLGSMEDGTVKVSGSIDASAPNGGDGGFIETSAAHVKVDDSARITTFAPYGKAGSWLIDPTDYTIAAVDPLDGSSYMSNTALSTNLASTPIKILTQATGGGNGDIFVNDAVSWSSGNTLTLYAHNNINVNAAITNPFMTAGIKLILRADSDANGAGTVTFGGTGAVNTAGYGIVSLYYNPANYASPTDYSSKISGTYTSYMLVNDVNNLQAMNTNLTGAYALGKNIDASAMNTGAGFEPIGNSIGTPTFFSGTFNGNNNTITGLYINRPTTDNVGLFGNTNSAAIIRNVGLVNGNITGRSMVGGLVGSNHGTISNSYSTSSVTGSDQVGGLVGYNDGDTGGVGIISNSYSTGAVSGFSQVGGLVGYHFFNSTIINSYSTAMVTGGTGSSKIGGLVGEKYGAITNSYSTGAVSGGTGSSMIGGLVGFDTGGGGAVISSYWDTVTSTRPTSDGGTGKTTAEMMTMPTGTTGEAFSGWDITANGGSSAVWRIYGGKTYPLLRSFLTPTTITANNASKTYDSLAYSGGNGVTCSAGACDPTRYTAVYGGTSQGAINANTYTLTTSGFYSGQLGYDITAGTDGTLTVNRAPVNLTGSRNYDGTVNVAGVIFGTIGSLVGSETLTVTGTGTVANKNVGASKPVTLGTLALVGDGLSGRGLASNYSFSGGTQRVDISQAPLVLSTSSVDRTYDGSLTAAGTLAVVSGTVFSGDTLSGGTFAFTNKNVGIGNKTVTTSGVTVNDGNSGGNYNLSYADNNTNSIRRAPLTLSTANVTKTYDGGFTAAGTATVAGGTTLFTGDTLSGGTFAFTDKNVGNGNKTVTVSGVTVTDGNSGGNYNVSYASNTASTINPYAVSLTGSRTYDGTANVAAGIFTLGTLVAGEALTLTGAGTVADKNVGTGKTVTLGTLALGNGTGGLASNYTFTGGTRTADITLAPLTLSTANVTKTYDGGFTAAGAATVAGGTTLFTGDTLSGGTFAFTDKNVGNGNKTVTVSGVTVNDGNSGGNYNVSYANNTASTINPYAVSLTGSRTYDGTANVAAGIFTLGTLVAGEALTLTGAGTVADKNVGTGKTVTLGTLALGNGTGGLASNYTFTGGTRTADITLAPLALSTANVTKTYDGGFTAAGAATVAGGTTLFTGDTLSGGTFAFTDKNVGNGNKTVTVSGVTVNDGNSGGNYNVSYANNTASTINPYAVSLTGSRTYDGTANVAAGIFTLGTLVAGEALTLTGSGTVADKNVGTGKTVTLGTLALGNGTGGLASNYTFTGGTRTADITLAPLTLSTANVTKTYDGGFTAAGTATVAGGTTLFTGDTLSGGTFAFTDKNVGNGNKTVTVSGVTVTDGNSGGNYNVSYASNTASTINPYAVSLTGSRTYDGTANVAAGIFTLGTLVAGEALTLTGSGTVADKNVGTGKTVTLGALALGNGTGGLASNYTFTGGTQTADITARTLNVTATGVNKVYDGLTGATVTLADNRIAGDLLTTGYTAAFPDKNVGTGKTVNVSGINLTGTDAGNYSLTNTAAATTADITPRLLSITAAGVNKVYDGLTGATVTLADNRIAGDLLSTGYTGAAYLDKNVGTGKAVNVSGINLTGTDAGNYSLTNAAAATTADITARALTVAAATNAKGYDGKTNAAATPSITSGSLAGSDTATLTEVYDSKTAGTGKTLIPAAVISDGNGGNNYLVTYVNNTSGVIEPGQIVSGLLDVAAGGKTIDFVVNGTLLTDQAATDASGNYSLMLPLNSIPSNSALLAYVANDASLKSASVYLSTGGNITNLALSSNTVTAAGGGTMSNTTFGTARGSLSSGDIPYSLSGTNLTLSPNFSFKTAGGTAYSINGNITTTNAAQTYGGPVALLANAVLGAGTGNISFGGPVTGTGFNLTLNTQGTVSQTAPITVKGLELAGAGGTYNLTNTGNAITTLAGNTGTVNFTNNSGIDIGTVNTTGLTTSGNFTLNSAGTITQSAPLQVAGITTLAAGATQDITLMNAGNNVSSIGITSGKDVSLRNTGALALNVSTVSNSLSATAGGDITLKGLVSAGAGEVTLKSSGAVINGLGGATSISAGALFAEAANGIGSGDPLMTAVNRLAALNTTANNIEIDNTGVLTVSDLRNLGTGNVVLQNIGAITTGTSTVTASVGTVSITAHSPLTIGSGGVSASGDISLEASPSDGSDNLTINGNIASSNGNIVLKAGSSIVYNPGSDLNAPHGTITLADVNGTSAATPSTVATGNTTATNNTVAALKTSEGTTIAKVETTSDSDKKKEDEERKKKEESGEKKTDDKKTGDNTKNYCN